MKKFLFLFFLVLSTVAFCNNAPPDFPEINHQTGYIPAVENLSIDLPAVELQMNQEFAATQAEIIVETSEYEYTMLVVREVTANRKTSVNITASGYATEPKAENAVLCSTDRLDFTTRTIPDSSMEWRPNKQNEFQRNYQHSNYGYPLSAD